MVSSSGTPQKSLVQQKISFGSQGNLKLTPPSGLSTPPATPKRRRGKGDSPEIPEPPSKRVAVSSNKSPCKPGITPTEKTRARNVEQTIRNPKRGAQNSSQTIYVPSTPTSPTTPLELPSTSVSSNDTTTNGTTRGQSLCESEYDRLFDDDSILSLPDPEVPATPTVSSPESSSTENSRLHVSTGTESEGNNDGKRNDKGKGREKETESPIPSLHIILDTENPFDDTINQPSSSSDSQDTMGSSSNPMLIDVLQLCEALGKVPAYIRTLQDTCAELTREIKKLQKEKALDDSAADTAEESDKA